MNLQVISEHTIDVSLLPEKGARILDLGCRGLGFRKAFPQHMVTSVDCDDLGKEESYMQVAISDYDGRAGVKRYADPQATVITLGDEVERMTIQTLSKKLDCKFWDVIKIDIEGSEREVIRSLNEPLAKQLSVEFHLHSGAYDEYQVNLMVMKLQQLGYQIIQHEKEARHGAGKNYWDSLFILQ